MPSVTLRLERRGYLARAAEDAASPRHLPPSPLHVTVVITVVVTVLSTTRSSSTGVCMDSAIMPATSARGACWLRVLPGVLRERELPPSSCHGSVGSRVARLVCHTVYALRYPPAREERLLGSSGGGCCPTAPSTAVAAPHHCRRHCRHHCPPPPLPLRSVHGW